MPPCASSSSKLPVDLSVVMNQITAEDSLVVLPLSIKPYLYAHLISHIGARFLAIVPKVEDVHQATTALTTATKHRIVAYADPSKRIGPTPNFLITTSHALANAQDRQHFQQHTQRMIILDDVDQLQTQSSFSRIISFVFSAGTAPARIVAFVSNSQSNLAESHSLSVSLCLTQAVIVSAPAGSIVHVVKPLPSARKRRPHRTDIRHTVPGTLNALARKGSPAEMFFSRVSTMTASPFAKSLHSLVTAMNATVSRVIATASPLFLPLPNHNPWIHFVDALKARTSQDSIAMQSSFSHWKQALDVLVRTWEQADWASVTLLRQAGCDTDKAIGVWPPMIAAQIRDFWKSAPFNHQPLFRLRGISLENAKAFVEFRLVVVVDFAILAHAVEYYVRNDSMLKSFEPVVVYSVDENSEACTRLTPRQARLNLDSFSTKKANMLITTADYEQHNIIPDRSCVIRLYSGAEGSARAVKNDSVHAESDKHVTHAYLETAKLAKLSQTGLNKFPDTGSLPVYSATSNTFDGQNSDLGNEVVEMFKPGLADMVWEYENGQLAVGRYGNSVLDDGGVCNNSCNAGSSLSHAHAHYGAEAAGSASMTANFAGIGDAYAVHGIDDGRGHEVATVSEGEGSMSNMNAGYTFSGVNQRGIVHSVGYTGIPTGLLGTGGVDGMKYDVAGGFGWGAGRTGINAGMLGVAHDGGLVDGTMIPHGNEMHVDMHRDWTIAKSRMGVCTPNFVSVAGSMSGSPSGSSSPPGGPKDDKVLSEGMDRMRLMHDGGLTTRVDGTIRRGSGRKRRGRGTAGRGKRAPHASTPNASEVQKKGAGSGDVKANSEGCEGKSES